MTPTTQSSATPTIRQIEATELFGSYSYKLVPSPKQFDDDSLFLLYGDNGAGKSTILKLLFHLLHPEPFGGHRTYISKIPFKRFEVILNSGLQIRITKSAAFSDADYDIHVSGAKVKSAFVWRWKKDVDKRNDTEYSQLCGILEQEGPNLFFLPDTRRLEGMTVPTSNVEHTALERVMAMRIRNEAPQDPLAELTSEAIERVAQSFRQQMIDDTNTGYTSVNTIYVELLQTIISKKADGLTAAPMSVMEMREKLESLNTRNALFSKYGLTPALEIDKLDALLKRGNSANEPMLSTVLKPYLDGHSARLDALSKTQAMIDQFVSTIADFFLGKQINFNLHHGVQIKSSSGQLLTPEHLSSGEKQLLLLFCNAITARKDGTIFIIDEPEISLNVKWQRKLIKALLGCLSGVKSQIVLATHSIEILAQYDEFVTPLVNTSRQG